MKKLLLVCSLLVAVACVQADVQKEDLDTDAKKVGYIIGQSNGLSMLQQYVEIDPDAFFNGFKEGYAGKTNVFSEEEVREIMSKFQE